MIAGRPISAWAARGLLQRAHRPRSRAFQPDRVPASVAELLAILDLVDHLGPGADHLDAVAGEDAERSRARAVFSAVWPPMVGRQGVLGAPFLAMICSTIAAVIGST